MKKITIGLCVILCMIFCLVGCRPEPEVTIQKLEVHSDIKELNNEFVEESPLIINLDNLKEVITDVNTDPENFIGKEALITGYLSKLEDDKLYYFIADDVCLGCDGESQWGHFIEMFNIYQLDLIDYWTDDMVTVEGVFDIAFNEEGYEYPVFNIVNMSK